MSVLQTRVRNVIYHLMSLKKSYGFGLNQFLGHCNLKTEILEKHTMINENV